MPEGNLTPVQHAILEAVWDGPDGATVAEIWQHIATARPVTRTTVLNLVQRLEKRGWLVRQRRAGVARYTAALSREETAARLAGEFVTDFFGGSTTNLVMSLLGSRRLTPADLERLRRLVEPDAPKGRRSPPKSD